MDLTKQIFEFSLTDGKRAEINVPVLLNKKDIQILKNQLNVMELQARMNSKQDQRNELKKRRLKKVTLNRITM
ncbi:hypothetical protein KC480_06120 [Bacillus velezensis]|uniref:hypothetical protein n=1 Tax=Bacillus velezensis TaxID=492670 RepID=UPI001E51B825|nr:hypothetical protein [Bacillus velezensis]MCD7911102.1 hypothetical protein [Bacillus velezensis]